MAPARTPSTTGLRLLDAQTRVGLTGTPNYQDMLRRFAPATGGPPSQVQVELVPAPIRSTAQAGWWGLEARIDGSRVGELIQPEAGWYWPLVDDAVRRGHRPGAEAHVTVGERGTLDVELYLPVVAAQWVALGPADHPAHGEPRASLNEVSPSRRRRSAPR